MLTMLYSYYLDRKGNMMRFVQFHRPGNPPVPVLVNLDIVSVIDPHGENATMLRTLAGDQIIIYGKFDAVMRLVAAETTPVGPPVQVIGGE